MSVPVEVFSANILPSQILPAVLLLPILESEVQRDREDNKGTYTRSSRLFRWRSRSGPIKWEILWVVLDLLPLHTTDAERYPLVTYTSGFDHTVATLDKMPARAAY